MSERLIERYKDKWDWRCLSQNESLPLSESLLERYADKWEWGVSDTNGWQAATYNGLSLNKSLPWSEALIERYKDKWNWGEFGLSSNKSLPWSELLIERYADKWEWFYLYRNHGVKKLFRNWTKQEISAALERIKLAANRNDDYDDPDDIPF